jgi:indole-3-glycerol phosphate synthase
MEGILDRIVARKREEVAAARRRRPESRLLEESAALLKPRPFRSALVDPGPADVRVIAEFKRASPSRGAILLEADPAAVAAGYETAGAAALSVLTDRDFFQGAPSDLGAARAATRLPVLRKDFIVDAWQIFESRAMGADAVLLIARILAPTELADYLAQARETGLDVLVEIHAEDELEPVLAAGADLVGINSRDLATFRTDLATAERLAARLPTGVTAVAESGIRTAGDLVRLRAAGINSFLIGEVFMSAPDPGEALGTLLEEYSRCLTR